MLSPSKNVAHYGLAWLALVLATLAGTAWWWNIGRPVSLPDAPSDRISCVSYAPFRKPGETPFNQNYVITPERIDEDLRALSQRFDCVRTYSQSNGLSAVPAIAARYHMQVLMGIWLGGVEKLNEKEVATGIATANAYPKSIRGIIVGNEVLLRGDLSPARLAGYIEQVRAATPKSIPVTYADVWQRWLKYPQMAKYVDFVTIHILPYWEDDPVQAVDAVQHLKDVYAQMKSVFPDKTLMVGETGWPSAGRLRRSAEPSVVDEALYIRDFLRYAATVDMPYNVIETFDQPWKRSLEGTVGGYWGIFDSNERPKFPMRGPVTEEPRWWLGWLAGAVGAMAFVIVGTRRRAWHGARGWLALLLAGFAAGTSAAWQVRQMIFACAAWWEWLLSSACLLGALCVAAALARRIAAHLADHHDHSEPAPWWRFSSLFALVLYDILMAFDGRYLDFPMGLFLLPGVAYGVFGLLTHEQSMPSAEQRFMACVGPLLAIAPVVMELGMNKVTWLWLGLNLAIAVPVLVAWRWHTIRLKANEAQATHQ
ncbi:glycoside hydrolase family 17 protein [Dyella mobilis]|uniref:Endo-1,3-beta-glucanase btgC n=1 Tax=Dyella mobilis TaxID=1849582 RepID=A0ABS2KBM7_9GAMM|nr:glycoside hydrolase family 17 [Dyella mobilis]MBM7128581.1 glycoside hydrolase family 17 [Dyella mobilis]GLQ99516.1 beta-1,6-glucan synthase [Dyella mobilis]